MIDLNECFDFVEILIENGVDINIWCKNGNLLIDFFKIVLLWFDEVIIDRGECFLGGKENKLFFNKERWYFGFLVVVFILLYILLFFNIVNFDCFLVGNSFLLNEFEWVYFYCMDYI